MLENMVGSPEASDEFVITFGEWIQKCRNDREISLEEVVDSGIDAVTWASIENGEFPASIAEVDAMANYLGLPKDVVHRKAGVSVKPPSQSCMSLAQCLDSILSELTPGQQEHIANVLKKTALECAMLVRC